jgi:hypothetical protein
VPTDEPPEAVDEPKKSRVTDANVTRDRGGLSRQCHAENRSKGQGEGQGEGDSTLTGIESPLPPLREITQSLADLAGLSLANANARARAEAQVQSWLNLGVDIEATAVPAIRSVIAKRRDPTRSLTRFDDAVRHAQAKVRVADPEAPKPANPGKDDPDPRLTELRQALHDRLGPRTYDGLLRPVTLTLNGRGIVATAPTTGIARTLRDDYAQALGEEAAALNLGTVKITNP